MSTLVEISRDTQLAVTTVSEILRNKPGYNAATRQRVLEAAERLHYRPSMAARQLRGGRSGLLGVLIGMDNPQVNFDRLAYVERLAFARGYRLVVGQVREGDAGVADYLDDFASRGLDGVIWLHQPFVRANRLPGAVFGRMGHVVALDEPLTKGGGCIRIDYAEGVRQAVVHLRERGRERIALALAGHGVRNDPMQSRLDGYRRALGECGAAHRPLVWAGQMVEQPTPELIEDALRHLAGEDRADAIIASNDVWAAAFSKALKARGRRVPADVAVVGFDNLSWTPLLEPALTTIDQQHDLFAEQALQLMADLLSGKRLALKARTVVVTPRLMVREST